MAFQMKVDNRVPSTASLKSILRIIATVSLMQWLLFVPLYFTRLEEGSFLPWLHDFPQALLTRNNPDFFRWSLEYALMAVIFLYFAITGLYKVSRYIISILYTSLFIFQCYYFIVWKIYGEIPIWTFDWALLQRVLPLFMKTIGVPILFMNLIILLSILSFYYLVLKIHNWLASQSKYINQTSWLGISALFFIIPFTLTRVYRVNPDSNQSKSGILWISDNIHTAMTKSRVKVLPDLSHPDIYKSYTTLPLRSKPNILLIFIEAYGTILGSVPPYDLDYGAQLKSMESNLAQHGWHSASALSNSTVLGGRSWLGFTSLISGLRLDNHPAYERLIEFHSGFPHLINTLRHHGYTTYRLNTMQSMGSNFNQIDSISGLYFNVAHWTRYSDIPYKGYAYDYFGGIPDQYALHFWHDHILKREKNPYFLFFITLSTHAPFYLPPPLVEDWRTLDLIKSSPHGSVRSEQTKPLDRYSKSVSYTLSVLQEYIVHKADTNTLIILVGDHQPAGMEYLLKGKTDTYAAPLHIICKDQSWIDRLRLKGFHSGMVPTFKSGSLLNHEGFYSFLMSTWAEKDSLVEIPPYLKKGIE